MEEIIVNVVASIVVIAIIGGAVAYIWKSKKSGKKCIGCPESCCPHRNSGGCSCKTKK